MSRIVRWACARRLVGDVYSLENVTDAERDTMVRRRVQLSLLFGNERSVDVNADFEMGYLDDVFREKLGADSCRQYRDNIRRLSSEGLLKGKLHFKCGAVFFLA